MNNENKIAKVFGSTTCLFAAIVCLSTALFRLIVTIIMLISGTSSVSRVVVTTLGIDWIIFIAPFVLIGVGLLLLYIKGRSGNINSTGIAMVKVCVMIRGIRAFVHMILLSLLIVISVIIAITALSKGDSNGIAVGIIIIYIVFLGICVFGAIMVFKYTMSVKNMLDGTGKNLDSGFKLISRFSSASAVTLVVLQGLLLVFTIIILVARTMIASALENIPSFVRQNILSDIYNVDFSIGAGDIVKNVVLILAIVCMMILIIVSIIINKKLIEALSDDSGNKSDESDEKNTNLTNEVFEDNDYDIDETVKFDDDKVFDSFESDLKSGITDLCGEIISLNGSDKGFKYSIKNEEEIIIGKDSKYANIIVETNSNAVSRKHCGIKYNSIKDEYQVIDYSMNGTYINSVRKLSKGIYVTVPKGTIINLAKENLDYKLN